eukprot:127681_1
MMKKKQSVSGVKLLNKYSELRSIIVQQSDRLAKVTTDEYLLELINRQNKLYKSIQQDQSQSVEATKDYNVNKEKYEILQQQRIDSQNKIELEFKKCNEMIDEENKLFVKFQQSKCKTITFKKKIEKLKSCSNSLVSMIKS